MKYSNEKGIKLLKTVEENGKTYQIYSRLERWETLNHRWITKKWYDLVIDDEYVEMSGSEKEANKKMESQIDTDRFILETRRYFEELVKQQMQANA